MNAMVMISMHIAPTGVTFFLISCGANLIGSGWKSLIEAFGMK